VLRAYTRLVEAELVTAWARLSQSAARPLKRCASSPPQTSTRAAEVDTYIADLRERHRRRHRLQSVDRMSLP